MKDSIKGLIVVVVWAVIYEVIPVWVVEYLLDQPNPLYSLGKFLENIPRLQDIVTGNFNSSTALFMGIIGFGIIAYGLYLFIRDVYRYS
jgi:hypothetical protein